MFNKAALLSLVSLVPVALGAVGTWGQCGGIGYNGETTCVSGSTCVKSNDYYSQCIPNSNVPTTTSTTTSKPVTSGGPTGGPSSTSPTSSLPSSTPAAGNPYSGKSVYVSPFYAAEVNAAAATLTDSAMKAKYAKVAATPTFIWLDVIAKVPDLATYLADAKAKNQILQIVVYDLPDRDCAAKASNGEFSIANGGAANYKKYIDAIVAQIKAYPDVTVVAVVEPDSLANLVTNLNVQKCSNAADTYKSSVIYALQQLSALGVYLYMDAGHAGWLGWSANLGPAAQLFADIRKQAGGSKYIRGLVTNVSNYNALSAASPDPITQGNSNYDELHYITALGPELAKAGWSGAQFLVDQGRSGRQNIRQQWGDWCNVEKAGFGMRPTATNTGSSLIDAIVWVKPGGESDGTSNTSSPRYDSQCGLSDAQKPAPEAGTWFQAYFQGLIDNANPAF